MRKKTIRALMLIPKTHPCVVELYQDDAFLQQALQYGTSEYATVSILKLSDYAGIIYNYDAALYAIEGNRKVGKRILVGICYVVGIRDGKLTSLSDKAIERYMERFWEPEDFSGDQLSDSYFDCLVDDLQKQFETAL